MNLLFALWETWMGRAFFRADDGHLLNWLRSGTIHWGHSDNPVIVLHYGPDYVIVQNDPIG